MTIYAFNKPSEVKFVYESILEGVSRFGWSWFDSANLTNLKDKKWKDMNDNETKCWSKSSFLLDIIPDDWIVHINVPSWGRCTAAKVIDRYSFDNKQDVSDFRHKIKIDKESIIEFDRNDTNVIPIVSRKLKLRGRYWRVQCESEFFKSLENLKTNAVSLSGESLGVYHLKKNLNEPLLSITDLIHKNHPGKNLEYFLAMVFRNIPNVVDVKENGNGWGTDFGADLIVKYQSGLPFGGLEKEETLIVQVKSYEGEHWETDAVRQIEKGIEKFNADSGMLITTAQKTENLEKCIENLANELEKPISLLAGSDVARFVMKYFGSELLI